MYINTEAHIGAFRVYWNSRKLKIFNIYTLVFPLIKRLLELQRKNSSRKCEKSLKQLIRKI